MAEKVLPLPLSGEEIRKAILDKLSTRLYKDGYLNANLAYDYFDATVTIQLRCHDVGRVEKVDITEEIEQGTEPEDGAAGQEGEFTMEPAPPNEVRVETGQDVPVLTKNKDGRNEIRGIRYKRPRKTA